MNKRDSLILCGLFLSKFNKKALNSLGFESFVEAYNVLSAALDAPPSTIKNYRDELDPYFPNQRKGWHQRPLRKHCQDILEQFAAMSLGELSALVKTLFDPIADLRAEELKPDDLESPEQSVFAKRLVTGRAAEGYFRIHYESHEELSSGTLVDTTSFGCGFDFRINFSGINSFYAVEVKGLYESNGSIMLTEKEHHRASQLRDRYFLYIVRNFRETPFATMWRDPLNSEVAWQLLSKQVTVNSWRTSL